MRQVEDPQFIHTEAGFTPNAHDMYNGFRSYFQLDKDFFRTYGIDPQNTLCQCNARNLMIMSRFYPLKEVYDEIS